MQLTGKKTISQALAVATCSLLSNVPQPSQAAQTDDAAWNFDISGLNYQESDDRIRVIEFDLKLKWAYNDDSALTAAFVSDSITGATPSGATIPNDPGKSSQTSTTASGIVVSSDVGGDSGNYLDPLVEFVDRRNGLALDWEKTFARTIKTNIGASMSFEDDYSSYGTSLLSAFDLNNRLTTLVVGAAVSWDFVSPKNGPPWNNDGLLKVGTSRVAFENGNKLIFDKMVGITQVLNRRTITQLTYTTGTSEGYLTDPYKVVTVLNDVTGNPDSYYYEKRPKSRARDSIYWEISHQPKQRDVINISYRYYWDDWDITSHTLDFRYRFEFLNNQYLQPHIRYYRQSAANFFRPNLTEQDVKNLPQYVSSDYRLDKLSSTTIGLKYGLPLGKIGTFMIRIEKMMQRGSVGDFKDLNATILQAAITLKFK